MVAKMYPPSSSAETVSTGEETRHIWKWNEAYPKQDRKEQAGGGVIGRKRTTEQNDGDYTLSDKAAPNIAPLSSPPVKQA